MPKRPDNVVIPAGIADVVLVVAFVLIGRSSHGESAQGTLVTLWPFLIGLVAGWAVARAWRAPLRVLWTGVVIWAVTVVGGMLLRIASGQGAELPFVIVTLAVLGAFLIGWRAVSILVVRVLAG